MTKVVNAYNSKYDVDIRRPGQWGNPFIIGKDGNREEVIQKYEEWITNSPQAEHLREMLPNLQDKVLGCCCKPKACHGDILVKLIENLNPKNRW
jgi:hypothetical protein